MTNSEGSFSGIQLLKLRLCSRNEAAVPTKPVHLNDIPATSRVSPTHTLVDSMKHAAFINQPTSSSVNVSMDISMNGVSVSMSVSVSDGQAAESYLRKVDQSGVQIYRKGTYNLRWMSNIHRIIPIIIIMARD